MKKLEFESNGSKWLLLCANNREDYYLNTRVIDNPNGRVGNGVSLCMITEEQASEVVESEYFEFINNNIYRDYDSNNAIEVYSDNLTAIDSLHSLLKSKGVYLYENPFYRYFGTLEYQDYEKNTFYNPILFKILK